MAATSAVHVDDSAAATIIGAAKKMGALGGYIEGEGARVVIRTPATGAGSGINHDALSSAIRAAGSPQVTILPSKFTEQKIQEIQRYVLDSPDFAKSSMTLGYWITADRYSVSADTSADAIEKLSARYPGLVTAQTNDHPVEFKVGTRHADASPFSGGADIYGANLHGTLAHCTSALSVQTPGGTRFMVTAGHCFEYNTNVTTPNTNVVVGRVTHWDFPPPNNTTPGFDLSFLQYRAYQGYVYHGPSITSTKYRWYPDRQDAYIGTHVCFSGETQGTRCAASQVVDGTNQIACAYLANDRRCVGNLFCFPAVANGGDSGGPVYIADTQVQRAFAKGMISAGGTPAQVPTEHIFAVKISTITQHFGTVLIVTN